MSARVTVAIESRPVQLRVWKYEAYGIGGYPVPIYFLDSNLAENSAWDRTLTDCLYGGDQRYRLCQEIVLGIGGVRVLGALGYSGIERFHMNEGHAGLLALELLDQEARKAGRDAITPDGVEAVRQRCVFTTHTPVPAGHDQFPLELVDRVLGHRQVHEMQAAFCCEGALNMTFLALNLSHYVNGVAKKHGELARLLSTGMVLTIALGALAARWVFPRLSWGEAGILASILAPTDAGLGQIIVNSPRVPMRIRQALNVEAGLNDGLSVPFLLFFMALAAARTEGRSAGLMQFVVEQLGFGALTGVGIGLMGGWLLGLARHRGWMAEAFQQIGVVALPLLCLVASEMAGASMFIAAFVAGLAVQIGFKEAGQRSVEFAEEWGQLFNFAVFFLFGLVVARDWPQFGLAPVLYAALSLTVVRLLPVVIALIGTGLSPASALFMGWFGPRGLASIVLGLVYLEEEIHSPGEATIRLAVMATVLLSIFAHGPSVGPGIALYARKVTSLAVAAPERRELKV